MLHLSPSIRTHRRDRDLLVLPHTAVHAHRAHHIEHARLREVDGGGAPAARLADGQRRATLGLVAVARGGECCAPSQRRLSVWLDIMSSMHSQTHHSMVLSPMALSPGVRCQCRYLLLREHGRGNSGAPVFSELPTQSWAPLHAMGDQTAPASYQLLCMQAHALCIRDWESYWVPDGSRVT